MRHFVCAVVVLLSACSQVSTQDRGHSYEDYVWVEKHFHNGDGGNFVGSTPPSINGLLASVGIISRETAVTQLARCMGPGCPTYSARHFARIPVAQVGRAAELGFETSSGPLD